MMALKSPPIMLNCRYNEEFDFDIDFDIDNDIDFDNVQSWETTGG